MEGLKEAGIVHAKAGKVRLLGRTELDPGWAPEADARLTVWEVAHYLLAAHEAGGDQAAAQLAMRVGARAEAARDLAYRLYTVCDRQKWSQAAQPYNALVVAWSDIERAMGNTQLSLPANSNAKAPGLSKVKRVTAKVRKAAG